MNIFTVQTDVDDIEVAMNRVAQAVREWEKGKNQTLAFSLASRGKGQVLKQARQLQLQWNVDANAIIHSTRPKIGPWIIRFQNLIRRATWWFLEPILQQIRAFQMNTARVVEGLAENQTAILAESEELRSEIEQRLESLETETTMLRSHLRELKGGDGD